MIPAGVVDKLMEFILAGEGLEEKVEQKIGAVEDAEARTVVKILMKIEVGGSPQAIFIAEIVH